MLHLSFWKISNGCRLTEKKLFLLTSLRILMTLSDLVVLVMEVMSRTTHSDMVTVVRLR